MTVVVVDVDLVYLPLGRDTASPSKEVAFTSVELAAWPAELWEGATSVTAALVPFVVSGAVASVEAELCAALFTEVVDRELNVA